MVAQSTLDAFIIRPQAGSQGPANPAENPFDPAARPRAGIEAGLRSNPQPVPGKHPRAARKPRRVLKQLYLSSPEAGAGGSGASQGGVSATSEQPGPARAAAPGRQAELQLQVDVHQNPGDPPPDPETCTRAAPERPKRGRRLQLPARTHAQEKPSAACGDAGGNLGVAGAAGRAADNPACVDLTASSHEAGPRASKRPAEQRSGGGKDAVGMQPGFDRFRFGCDGKQGSAGSQAGAALPSEAAVRELGPRKRARA